MYCHQLHCSLGNPAQSFELTSSAVQRYPVWSSPMKYIHVQRSTVFVSFIWKRAMHFGADQSSEMQWTDCPVWYFPVQLKVVQCSAVWRSQAQAKTSEVLCKDILCGLVQWSTFTCSAVQSLSVSFGNVQCTSVHISLARCSEPTVLYGTFQFNWG